MTIESAYETKGFIILSQVISEGNVELSVVFGFLTKYFIDHLH